MQVIRQSYIVHAHAADVWKALVDPKLITAWSGSPAKMDESVGSKFELWNGDIYGKNVEVIKKKRLVQEWYGGKWPKPSMVHIALSEENGTTYIDLLHEDVPDKEREEVNKGWKNFYFLPLKRLVENGSED